MDEDGGHGSLRQLLWFVCTLLGGGKERSRERYRVLAVGGLGWTNYERGRREGEIYRRDGKAMAHGESG